MPATEKRGRRHSSEVIVAALDTAEASARSDFRSSDVREDTYRSQGAGGQHRNKTDSAIRLTHLPTGVIVTASEQRSQHQNRAVAWERLEARMSADAAAEAHGATNQLRQAAYDEFRSWTWCGWRDEVKGPDGRRASMNRVLAGRLSLLL